jgi:transcriptional regulator with XRE-family HTH domain
MYEDFFVERLASLRNQKSVSAREMSLALGQNGSYINRIENKLAFPSMQSFFYICEYLQISPKEFFDVDNPAPGKINQIIEEAKKLDDFQLDTVLTVITGLQHKAK